MKLILVINHLQNGIDADCSSSDPFENDLICGGSAIFEHNDNLYYLKKLQLKYGPQISNDGGDYTFDCFATLTDLEQSNYGYRSGYGTYDNDQEAEECLVNLSLMLKLYIFQHNVF